MMLKQSVADYARDSDDILLRDLLVEELRAGKAAAPVAAVEPPAALAADLEAIGWIVSNCDQSSTEATSAQEELSRLQVLRTYTSVNAKDDDGLNQLTALASEMLQHDYTWISLQDLRVQWVVSSRGLGGLQQAPRHLYFPCAHALRTRRPVLLVEDLRADPRFARSPLTTGPLFARFYAAAPLISPEGYRIGVFGVASRAPGPMTGSEQAILVRLAGLAVARLVELRRRRDLEDRLKRAVACTSHDIMTPLMGLQLSVAALRDDPDLPGKLSEAQRDLLATADSCIATMCQLGTTAMQDVHEGLGAGAEEAFFVSRASIEKSDCVLADLVDRLHQIIEPIEKRVPLMIHIGPDAPASVRTDEVKVFRATLALLCLACARTTTGYVMLHIDVEGGSLVFSCESTCAAPTPTELGSFVDAFRTDDTDTLPCLRLAGLAIRSIGGICGFDSSRTGEGSILWYKVPITGTEAPRAIITQKLDKEEADVEEEASTGSPVSVCDERHNIITPETIQCRNPQQEAVTIHRGLVVPRAKKVLVVDDSLIVRKSLQRALTTKFGYQVTLAQDGLEGLTWLQETVFDFVLMDFLMPVMDGWDCTLQYRQWEARHRPWFRQHIIGMSAHAGDRDVQRAGEIGMDDYKCKPVTIKTLSNLVDCLKIKQIQAQLDCLLPRFGSAQEPNAERPVKKQRESLICLSNELAPRLVDVLAHSNSSVVETEKSRSDFSIDIPLCLVCRSPSASSLWSTISISESFRRNGWNLEVVMSGDEALARLKRRNYDAVIVESDLIPQSEVSCISTFRDWESSHRVNRQKNVLVHFPTSDSVGKASSRGGSMIVQPPAGFDGVLMGSSALWENLRCHVEAAHHPSRVASVTGIVLR